jgi:hypothetical protein
MVPHLKEFQKTEQGWPGKGIPRLDVNFEQKYPSFIAKKSNSRRLVTIPT